MTNLYAIIRDHFGLTDQDQLTSTTRWDGDPLNADSLDRIELAMKIEDQMQVQIDDADMYDMATIGDLDNWLADQKEKA